MCGLILVVFATWGSLQELKVCFRRGGEDEEGPEESVDKDALFSAFVFSVLLRGIVGPQGWGFRESFIGAAS